MAAVLAGVVLTIGAGPASAARGGGTTKTCVTPTLVGQAMICEYVFTSNDTFKDTMRVKSLVDTVFGTTSQGSGNILSLVPIVVSPSSTGQVPTCAGVGMTGSGTLADPYIGATTCDVPAANNNTSGGASITANPINEGTGQPIPGVPYHTFYTVLGSDYTLNASHSLTDSVTYGYNDLCDVSGTGGSCNPVTDATASAISQTTVKQFTPSVNTQLSADTIQAGGKVHDSATLSLDPSSPPPPGFGGTVTYSIFTDNACKNDAGITGFPDTESVTNGVAHDSVDATFPSTGHFWFQASYSGDSANGISGPVVSVCTSEPLTVVDARISISASGVNKVGAPHTFTVLIESDPGTGTYGPVSGVTVSPSIVGTGSIVTGAGAGTCTTGTTGADGKCTVVVTSNSTGSATVNATASVDVTSAGLATGHKVIDVSTTGYGANTVDNNKTWVDARISITQSGTNATGTPHTFTVLVEQDPGTGTFGPVSGLTVTAGISGTGAIVTGAGAGTCTTGTTGADGKCTIVVTSNSAGIATVNASTSVDVTSAGLATGHKLIAVSTSGDGAFTVSNQKLWINTTVVNNGTGIALVSPIAAPVTVHDVLNAASGVNGDTVDFTLYTGSSTCQPGTGVTTTTQSGVVIAGGVASSNAVTLNPSVTTSYSYLAHYNGGTHNGITFPAKDAACEPFQVTFTPVVIFNGCTPGFWKNHGSSLWDSAGDKIPKAMPTGLQFFQNTKFDSYFGVTAAQSGIPTTASMIDVLNMGGGGGIALGRQAVSALLSVAAGMNYMFPSPAHDFTSLYNLIVQSYTTGNPSIDTLEQQLDTANSKEDPPLC
jgi:hypothetical protein